MRHKYKLWFLFIIIMIIGIFVYTPYTVVAMDVATKAHSTTGNNMTPFYWTVAIVGGLIAITLSYVSFKKYKGDKKKRTNNDPNS